MSHTNQFFSVLFSSALFLAACSAHVSGGDGSTPPVAQQNFADPRPTIQGPSVAGHWVSACNLKPASSGYRTWDITYAAGSPGTVVRLENMYTDSACKNPANTVSYHGYYRFIDKYANGNYNIEYAFDLGNGITSFPQEDILTANNQLFISDFVAGSAAAVLQNEPLYPYGTTPSSTNVSAVQVTTYGAAKYAFCSTQGRGVMVDLTSMSLAQNGSGTVVLGTKLCGSTTSVAWSAQSVPASVSIVNGSPQVTFPGSAFGDYIRPFGSQSGLTGGAGAAAVLNGNSGECFFISNQGTQNLPFIFPCQ